MAKWGKKKKGQFTSGLSKEAQDFLHLKEFSQGKPNELSFNVLEKKASAQSEKPKRSFFGRKEEGAGVLSRETRAKAKSSDPNHAIVGAAKSAAPSSILGADSQAEIDRRRAKRRNYKRMSIAVVAVVCVCLVGVGGYYAVKHLERLSTNKGLLMESADYIGQADETIIAIDEFFQTSFNDETVETAENLKSQIPAAKDKLNLAKGYAERANADLEGAGKDKEAAERSLNTIVSRETLLTVSEKRLADDIAAKQAFDEMEAAEANIQEVNSLLAQAARVVSTTTEENVNKSTEYTLAAQGSLTKARENLNNVASLYPSADLTALTDYLEKRIAATSEALASNAAILLQDRATAEGHNATYNELDAEAVELAKNLPSKFTQPLVDAYAKNSEALTAEYETARSEAAGNDSFLRDYFSS